MTQSLHEADPILPPGESFQKCCTFQEKCKSLEDQNANLREKIAFLEKARDRASDEYMTGRLEWIHDESALRGHIRILTSRLERRPRAFIDGRSIFFLITKMVRRRKYKKRMKG